jgi:hemolysin III
MKRTKLKDRILPNYSRGEEIFNMVSHIVGGALGILALVLCVVMAVRKHKAIDVVGCAIYGASMTILYTVSSIYHGLNKGLAKKVMQVVDHCTIYFLIAGTYTPILLSAIRLVSPVACWVLLCIEWGLAFLAATLTAIDLKRYEVFSMVCYVSMGWCIVFIGRQLIQAVSPGGLVLLFGGGVAYTVGAVLYGIGKKKRYMHSVFHLFCLAGSLLHFLCILLFIL